MVKASLKLPNGTAVTIDGTPEEVQQLLDFCSGPEKPTKPLSMEKPKKRGALGPAEKQTVDGVDLATIIYHVKACDEAELIEKNILDRTSQIDRTLLPLYIVHEYMDNATGLTSGEISKVTIDLGVPVSQPHVSNALSGIAMKYVIGDKIRKKGTMVRYKLSRRGAQYLKGVVSDRDDDR